MLRHIWRNFSVFWKSQIYWPLVGAVLVLTWQYFSGRLFGSIRENFWHLALPYIGLIGLFLVVNVGHAIFRAEWKALKKFEHEEHRANRKAEMERSKPPIPEPNLRFRRVFLSKIFVGHELSGSSYNAWVAEIGNELADREVGQAREVRAHVTYLDEKDKILHTLCPARWGTYQPEPAATISQGESNILILAYDKGRWASDLSDGVYLPDRARMKVRLIDSDGEDVLGETLTFDFHTWGLGESDCKRV